MVLYIRPFQPIANTLHRVSRTPSDEHTVAFAAAPASGALLTCMMSTGAATAVRSSGSSCTLKLRYTSNEPLSQSLARRGFRMPSMTWQKGQRLEGVYKGWEYQEMYRVVVTYVAARPHYIPNKATTLNH